MSRRKSPFFILLLVNSLSSPPGITKVFKMLVKGGKRTHADADCTLPPRAVPKTFRVRSTNSYSSSDSNKHRSYKHLTWVSPQQGTDSMNIPFFLSNPWHIRACWRAEETTLFGQAEPCTPATGASFAPLLQWRGMHATATVLLRLHMACQQERSAQYGLIFLIWWWTTSRKDTAKRPCVQLYSLKLPDLLSMGLPPTGWLPRCPKSHHW